VEFGDRFLEMPALRARKTPYTSDAMCYQQCLVLAQCGIMGLPPVLARCTASSLNSRVNVRCFFCMILTLSVEVHFLKFTFHIFLGQDQTKMIREAVSKLLSLFT
jgi:hypothetical protein